MYKEGNSSSLIFGVATNDLREHRTKWKDEDGITRRCPFYIKWHSMIRRCYSEVNLVNNPAYAGCFVDKDWLTFSNFKSWMERQDWAGKELDKDIYGCGKCYSPANCTFVSRRLNTFLTRVYSCNGGTDFHIKTSKWRSRCSNNSDCYDSDISGVSADSTKLYSKNWREIITVVTNRANYGAEG